MNRFNKPPVHPAALPNPSLPGLAFQPWYWEWKGKTVGRSVKDLSRLEPVFDHEHLSRYTMSSAELEREIIGLFRMQLPDLIAHLRGEVTAADWRLFTHTLKGSAKAVGAMQIGTIAEMLESVGQDGRMPLLAELDVAVAEFEDAVNKAFQ